MHEAYFADLQIVEAMEQTKKDNMKLKRIAPEKFRVGRYVLNYAELLQLQIDVAKGIKPSGIVVESYSRKLRTKILSNGCLESPVKEEIDPNDLSIVLFLLAQDKDKDTEETRKFMSK